MQACITTINMPHCKFFILICGVLALSLSSVHSLEAEEEKALKTHNVVPAIIPTNPVNTANIKYGDLQLKIGDELTPTQVHEKPTVSWPTEDGAYYTLFMNDPDVPRSIAQEFQHWIVFNIPGKDISKGDVAFDYYGAGPPKNTGLHRYIFLIYKQDGLIEKEKFGDLKDSDAGSRKKFLLADLLKRFNYEKPVAANFFRAQYDENVPKYAAERLKKN